MSDRPRRVARRNSHCSWCGHGFPPEAGWPRTCVGCGETSFANPLPVVVLLVPVGAGILLVRRNIPPAVGELALPGGYLELGETWQEGAARELVEETGIRIDPAGIVEFRVRSAPNGVVLLFGTAPAVEPSHLERFAPHAETQELVVAEGPATLAFSLHTEALAAWFAARSGQR